MVDSKKTGILSFQHLRALVRQQVIRADVPITSRQIQPASLDLRLGTKAYRLLSSFLPEPSDQQSQFTIEDLYRSDMVMYDMDLTNGAILEKGHVYLVPLMERSSCLRISAVEPIQKVPRGGWIFLPAW